jgi:hypothetical protein
MYRLKPVPFEKQSFSAACKRMIIFEVFPATLKRCFPLLKQRAPTKLKDPRRCTWAWVEKDRQRTWDTHPIFSAVLLQPTVLIRVPMPVMVI